MSVSSRATLAKRKMDQVGGSETLDELFMQRARLLQKLSNLIALANFVNISLLQLCML